MTSQSLTVTLNWQGPFEDQQKIPSQAGIYMIIAGKKGNDGGWDPSSYRIIDIGQSGRTGKRLAVHDREACWASNSEEDETILFKYALMPSGEYSEDDRRTVECCLRAHHRPLPCGMECNSGYTRENAVVITNTGKYKPLEISYSCQGSKK
jgi:hypothetical protein